MKRVDMHLHTRHSFDCLNAPRAVIDAARNKNIDIVCVTDHNEIAGALKLKDRFPEEVIVGEEVKTREGVDVIGLFLTELIPKGTPARETCDLIHEQGGIVYVPHPYAAGKGGSGSILSVIEDQIDIVEGFNGRIHQPALNRQACEWARARELPLGAGSDAHTLTEVGRGFVQFEDHAEEVRLADDFNLFRRLIRTATIHGQPASPLVHAASTYAKLHKRMFTDPEWT